MKTLSKTDQTRLTTGILLFLAVLLSSLPLLIPGIQADSGQDTQFHLMRIEGLAAELLAGQFPVRMQSAWMDGFGYPVSIYYNDLLLYVPAVLRLLGVPVTAAYKIYVIAVSALTALLAYVSFRAVTKDETASALGALAYTTNTYRLLDIYIRGAVGEYSAMAFFPLILWGVWNLYTAGPSSRDKKDPGVLPLILGLSGVIGTHMLSAEMSVVVLAIICVLLLPLTLRRQTLLLWIKSAAAVVLLNLYFIVPFLDYYRNVRVCINERMEVLQQIQGEGAFLTQYLDFFANPFGTLISHGGDIMSFTPGLLLVLVFFVALLVLLIRGKDFRLLFLTGVSGLMFWMSCRYFPWNLIERFGLPGRMLASVQFPWRYLAIAGVLLSLMLCILYCMLKEYETEKKTASAVSLAGAAAVAICVLTAAVFTVQYARTAEPVRFVSSEDVDTWFVGYWEYLPAGTDKFRLQDRQTGLPTEGLELVSRNGTRLVYQAEESAIGKTASVPVLLYKGYTVEGGSDLHADADGCMTFTVTEPEITISFRAPLLWTAANILTAAAWGLLFILRIRKKA